MFLFKQLIFLLCNFLLNRYNYQYNNSLSTNGLILYIRQSLFYVNFLMYITFKILHLLFHVKPHLNCLRIGFKFLRKYDYIYIYIIIFIYIYIIRIALKADFCALNYYFIGNGLESPALFDLKIVLFSVIAVANSESHLGLCNWILVVELFAFLWIRVTITIDFYSITIRGNTVLYF